MVENVIRALIAIALVALCFFLVIWVLGAIGLHLPGQVVNIMLVIAVLLVLLYLWRLFGASIRLP